MVNGQDAAAVALKEIMGTGAVVGVPEVIKVLEAALVEARAGRMMAVGVISVAKAGQVGCAAAGGGQLEIIAGTEVLKQNLLAGMTGRRSPIIGAR